MRPARRWQHVAAGCLFLLLPHLLYSFLWWGPSHQTLRVDYPVYQPQQQLIFMQAVRDGFFPLWVPGELGGIPFASYCVSGQYWPVTWLMMAIEPVFHGFQLEILTHIRLVALSLAGFFTYLVMRRLGLTWLPALVAGVVFMFNFRILGAFLSGSALDVVVWLPVMIYLIERIVTRPRLYLALLYALAHYMLLTPGHLQETLYCIYFANLYLLVRAVMLARREKAPNPWKRFSATMACFVGAQALAFGLCAVQLLPILEDVIPNMARRSAFDPSFHNLYHMTSDDLAYNVFYPWLPSVYSGFYGGQMAWLMIAAAGAGLFLRGDRAPGRERRMVIFLLVVWLLCILYSLGPTTPVAGALNAIIPYLTKFRAPGRTMTVGMFAMAGLCAYGVSRLLREDAAGRVSFRITASGCVVYLLAGLALAVGLDRARIAYGERAVIMPLLGYVSRYCPVLIRHEPSMLGTMSWIIIAVALVGLTALLLCRLRIISRAGLVVLLLAACLGEAAVYHRRANLLLDGPVWTAHSRSFKEVDVYHTRVGHSLAVYLHTLPPPEHSYETSRRVNATVPGPLARLLVHGGRVGWRIFLQAMPGEELPRAYVTPRVRLVKGNDLPAIAEMDPSTTSVIDLTDPDNALARSDPALARIADCGLRIADSTGGRQTSARARVARAKARGSVEVTSYTFNKAAFQVDTPAGGLFNYSDGYARGWRASVDGADTAVYRVNHAFKGVALPPGSHHVEFLYDPPSFRVGLLISLASACVFAVCAASCLTRVAGRRWLPSVLTAVLALAFAGFVYERVYERAHQDGLVNYVANAPAGTGANRQSSIDNRQSFTKALFRHP